jgi:hypothetical protein
MIIYPKESKHRGNARLQKSLICANPNRDVADSNKLEAPSGGPKRKISVSEIRGRTPIRTAGKENPARPNLDRRKISDKIAELYRERSLERNHETLREVAPSRDLATARSRKMGQRDAPQRTEFRSEVGRTQLRVADMKKKFEVGTAPKAPILMVPPSLPIPVFSNTSPFSKERKAIMEVRILPLPSPVSLPALDVTKSNISPKTVQGAQAIDVWKGGTVLNSPKIPLPGTTTRKETNETASNIRDRIKLFESIQGTKKPECEKGRSSYTRRIRTSMKSLFELTSRKSEKDDGVVGLSTKDVKDVMTSRIQCLQQNQESKVHSSEDGRLFHKLHPTERTAR